MITINDLSFKYGKKEVLNDISMKLEAGKIYGLLGENGVGKTTLLKIISGLQKPWKGSCSVFGEDPFKRTPSFLSRIFYLPEELEFIQNDYSIRYFAKINAPFYPKFDNEKFETILKEFEVEGDKKLNKLSYGQMKKAVLSFAIATNAELLLLDEPSNGLDIPSKTLFRRIIVQCVGQYLHLDFHSSGTRLGKPYRSDYHSRQQGGTDERIIGENFRKTLFRTILFRSR